jgi:hypothetical protein
MARQNMNVIAYTGSTSERVPYVHVVWPWLALPAAAVLLSTAFLIYTMIVSRTATKPLGIGVWKSTSLPLIFHGLDSITQGVTDQNAGITTSIMQMTKAARETFVELRDSGDGLKLT